MTSPLQSAVQRLSDVLDRLLDPVHGCPWDLKQTPGTTRMYLLEETYELLAAVEADDTEGVREELGDCFFLLCFLAAHYRKAGAFDLADTLNGAADKMIVRHPHIFGDGKVLTDPEEVKAQWHQIKQKEKKKSFLGGIPENLPALLRSHRLTERAGKAGFDWTDAAGVKATLHHELAELDEALESRDSEAMAHELGDVLFTLANLARHLKINAEDALRRTNDRFSRRFRFIEDRLAEKGRSVDDASLEEMDRLWCEAKKAGL